MRALPDGCYRAENGAPIFRISGGVGDFAGSDPRHFTVKADANHVEIYPHFYLHDEGDDAQAPQWVAVASQPFRTDRFALAWQGDRPVVSVPVEAYGELKVTPGKAC